MNSARNVSRKNEEASDMNVASSAIDISRLSAAGFFRSNANNTRTWIGHAGLDQFFLTRTDEGGLLIETSFPARHEQRIDVTKTACHFGGSRPWFLCPVEGCAGRTRILYLTGNAGGWACGKCTGRVYACRRQHRNTHYERLTRHARTLVNLERSFRQARTPVARQRVVRRALLADAALEESLDVWSGRLDFSRYARLGD